MRGPLRYSNFCGSLAFCSVIHGSRPFDSCNPRTFATEFSLRKKCQLEVFFDKNTIWCICLKCNKVFVPKNLTEHPYIAKVANLANFTKLMTLKNFSSQIRCWASSDNSLSFNYSKNGCPGNPGHPLGMPNKVRELQLSNDLQPRTAAQFANEPQKLE